MKTLFGDEEAHWNAVQNNGMPSYSPISHYKLQSSNLLDICTGTRAAQVVPHVHFHIVPRPPLDHRPAPNVTRMSYIMFGRGQREELDEEDGEQLAELIRGELAREVQRVREVEGVDLEGDWKKSGGKL